MKLMDKFLLQAFQNLPTTEVSSELHAAIFRAAVFRRSWRHVSYLTVILGVTFFLSLWHVYSRSVDIESFSALRAVANTLDMSLDSLTDSAKALFDFLPLQAIAISLLNFIAFVFMAFLMRSFFRLQTQFKM